MNFAASFDFARKSGEFTNQASLLRYVAALHPGRTRKQFVKAAVAEGYDAGSASNRFRESRKVSVEADAAHGAYTDKAGRFRFPQV